MVTEGRWRHASNDACGFEFVAVVHEAGTETRSTLPPDACRRGPIASKRHILFPPGLCKHPGQITRPGDDQ